MIKINYKSVDWMRLRPLYFILSFAVIAYGAFGLIRWGLTLGVDFTGGSSIEYKIEKPISTEEATSKIENLGISVASIQKTGEASIILKSQNVDNDQKQKIIDSLKDLSQGNVEEVKFENVGPSVGPELIKKTLFAIAISAGTILLWVAYQFKSFKFGVSAILAMFHDSFVLIGLFAIFGHYFGAEIDFLFVTALLTILSFSVHDTIVVYDRIREIRKKHGGDIIELANKAVSETMRRSINNSLTIIFMLIALVILGGETIRWFAMALLVGTISGTYSSPFVAVPILVTWEEVQIYLRKRRS